MILIDVIIFFKKLISVLSLIRGVLGEKTQKKIRMSWTTIREGRVGSFSEFLLSHYELPQPFVCYLLVYS